MNFSYKGRDKNGEQLKGEIEANDEASANSTLRESGVYVSEIKSHSIKPNILSGIFGKTSLKDKIVFTEQLGIMVKSGLSVVDALKALANETPSKAFAEDINQIVSEVKGGSPLSESMSKHSRSFDNVYVNTVKSGEKSGKLDEVLLRLSKQLEKDYAVMSKLKGAMIYPIVVLTAMVAVMILVMVVIIPQLTVIFKESGVPLPALTRAVIAISDFLRSYIIYIVVALVGITFALRYWGKTPAGRHLFDNLKLRIPVFGNLMRKTYMARFCRTFAGLAAAGLPLLDIFYTTRDVVGNVIYRDEIDKMAKKVEVGEPVSKVIKDSKIFPGMIGQLASVGEKSGSMDMVFDTLANFFDKEVDAITSNLSTLLEPMLMLFMGAAVGLLIVSVLQPIYGLVNAI